MSAVSDQEKKRRKKRRKKKRKKKRKPTIKSGHLRMEGLKKEVEPGLGLAEPQATGAVVLGLEP